VFAAFSSPSGSDLQEQPTTVMPALGYSVAVPALNERPGPPVPTGEAPAFEPDGRSAVATPFPTLSQSELPVVLGQVVSGEQPLPDDQAPDPFASVPARADSGDTFRGLTTTFDALTSGARPGLPNEPPPPAPGVQASLLDELPAGGGTGTPLPQSDPQPNAGAQPEQAAPAPRPSAGGLLADIPEEAYELPAVIAPRVEINPQATEAIAREYERELREKLEATKKKKTFVQQHGWKLIAAASVVVISVFLGGSYWFTQRRYHGETLDSALAKGQAAIAADTKEQYAAAIVALDQALVMDEGNTAALGSKAYAHAMLFAEHGRDSKQREAALAALTDLTRQAFPEYSVVVDSLVASEAGPSAARQLLLTSPLEKSLVQAHVGRLLLADRRFDEALAQLKKATELDQRQPSGSDRAGLVLAHVALGDYYLAFEDWESALEMLTTVEAAAPMQPARVLGQAQARLELGRELAEALVQLEALPKTATVPERLQGRYTLLLGGALAANGRPDDAQRTLREGLATNPQLAFDYQMGLGGAAKTAGQMDAAQRAFEEALRLNPQSEEAKAGLGRVLLARGRERELLERLKPEKDLRKVALLRGIAWAKLGDTRRSREELSRTQVGGKTPAEAAVYFALADAADDSQKAIELLESVLTKTRQKSTVQVALARVHLQKNQLDKARALLVEAAKDPHDYEANALLGQLLLEAGVPPELALEPLQRAVERNGSHPPARHLLTRTLLALGRVEPALKGIEAWLLDNPTLELAWKDAALTYLEAGRLKDAENAVNRMPLASEDLEFWRLKARVLFARGDGRGAMAALERANKLNPKDAETFCEIGSAFVRQGNPDTAQKAYAAAVREDAKSVCGIAGAYHARPTTRGKPAPSVVIAGLVAGSNAAWERSFLQATLARLRVEERDLPNAFAMAEEATRSAPAGAAGWFALGEVLRRQKNEEKAREAYQKAAELDASWSAVHLALADLLAKQGGDALPKAIAEYELVSQIDQNELEANRAKRLAAALKKQLKEP
jgi:tetratricopeptide (TPR) repeat protein